MLGPAFPYGMGRNAAMLRLSTMMIVAALNIGLTAMPSAQPIGPPISPDQVLRSQPGPVTTVPTPLPGNPTPALSAKPGRPMGSRAPRDAPAGNRTAECQHQAALERVPRGERASYVHNCLQGN